MKRVLFVSYYFPPMGGPGVQRSAKFVKYLPAQGYDPVVVTAHRRTLNVDREFQLDHSLEADVAGARRVEVRDPRQGFPGSALASQGVFKISWFLLYPLLWDPQVMWSLAALRPTVRAAARSRCSLVYTSLAPFSSAIIGHVVSKRLGVPWVADLRDLWTDDARPFYPSGVHYKALRAFEHRVLSRATLIIVNTPGAARLLRRSLGPPASGRIRVLPNGFDADDFPPARRSRRPDRFTLVHVGAFARDIGRRPSRLGRWVPSEIDESARTPRYLFEALRRFFQAHPDAKPVTTVRLVGYLHDDVRLLARRFELDDCVEATGYLPHDRALEEMSRAAVLLLLQQTYAEARREMTYVPAKLYEYLASGRPILALVPPGDTRDLVRRAGAGEVVAPTNPTEIADAISTLYTEWKAGEPPRRGESEFVRRFERRALTRKLADYFREAEQVYAEKRIPAGRPQRGRGGACESLL